MDLVDGHMGTEPIANPPDPEGERSAPVIEKTAQAKTDLGAKLLGQKLLGAARSDSVSRCRELIEEGADVNAADDNGWTPLFRAVEWEKANLVKLLIEHGANVNAKVKGGGTPLHLAAFLMNSEIAELLIKAGADANARDDKGFTPLDDAVEFGLADMDGRMREAISHRHANRAKAFKVLRDRLRKA